MGFQLTTSDAHELRRRLQRLEVHLLDGDRAALGALGLTPTQLNALRALTAAPEVMTVSALAEQLLCTRGNAARLVRRLVAAGLAVVHDDPDDQRLVRIRLTELGRAQLTAAEQALVDLDDRRFTALTDGGVAELLAAVALLEGSTTVSRHSPP